MAIKGKSRKRSKTRAPQPPKPSITVKKTPIVLRRDVKRIVVSVLAVLAFLGGARVWENVSRSDKLRDYDKALSAASAQFVQYFSAQNPSNVDTNVQNFQQGKLAAATFLTLTQTWDTDFTSAAKAVGKLKPPGGIREAQYLMQQGITGMARVARLWNLAAQLQQLADGTKDAKVKQSYKDKVQAILLQADDLRRQGAEPLFARGQTQWTNLNYEWGVIKKQPASTTPTQ